MPHETLEVRIDALSEQVQALRKTFEGAINQLPKAGQRYFNSSALAKEFGVSTRTVLRWVAEDRIDQACFITKKRGKGFQYVFDRQQVIPAIEAIQRGER